ncbi:uncharacterized protein LOC143051737 [Mytilus galloprovincialis]|uniref:uncharacterized protein LOC143051737 n=1 Tax=Mytilus galloprovincialis TaxID=29158 RepID=UPI003F7C9993
MLRLALILLVFYLVAQVYGRHPPVGLLKRYYDMVLHEREVDKCMGFPESFLDCAIVQGCENEACPKNMYCCSTDKCGNMCLCKRDPEHCNLFCHDGYILGANGCPECACRKKSQNEDTRRRGYYGRQVRRGYYGRQARREEKELESRFE